MSTRETECTEFGCRLEQAKKSLDKWVAQHDADQERIAELERACREALAEARSICGGDGNGCSVYRRYFDNAERRWHICSQCSMGLMDDIARALEGE